MPDARLPRASCGCSNAVESPEERAAGYRVGVLLRAWSVEWRRAEARLALAPWAKVDAKRAPAASDAKTISCSTPCSALCPAEEPLIEAYNGSSNARLQGKPPTAARKTLAYRRAAFTGGRLLLHRIIQASRSREHATGQREHRPPLASCST